MAGDEERVQRHAGDDAGQRDRQDQEERDGIAPEEREARDAERRHRAEDDRDPGRDQRDRAPTARRASRTSCECHATENQCAVNPGIGHDCMFDLLNA